MRLVTNPYPYFVQDGFLTSALVSDLKRNWPGEGYFAAEVPGNYVCSLVPLQQDGEFWGEFTRLVMPTVIFNVLRYFAPWIERKYPGEQKFYAYNYSLMQARGDYGGHNVHTHHYHDPCWVATLLVYLDNANGHQGTTVLRATGDEAFAAAQTLDWQGHTEEHETVEFKLGRLFAIHDNPIAFHSVKASSGQFGRRVLRAHIGASPKHCERLYGVPYAEYQRLRLEPTDSPQVMAWLERDLELLRTPIQMSAEEAQAWLKDKQVGVHDPRTEPSGAK